MGRTRAAFRQGLFCCAGIIALSQVAVAGTLLTISSGLDQYNFVNPDKTKNATDFHIFLFNGPGPYIDDKTSNGGATFAGPATFALPVVGGGFLDATFTAGGGAGVGPNLSYTFSFVGFRVGQQFQVDFSYADGTMEKPIATLLTPPPDPPTRNFAHSLPEPPSFVMASIGASTLASIGWYRRRRVARGTTPV